MRQGSMLILRKKDDLLMGLKKEGEVGAGKYVAPGGKLDFPEESPAACAIRETFQEVNVVVREEDLRLLGIVDVFRGDEHFWHFYVFWTDAWEGTPKESEELIPFYVSVEEIPYSEMIPSDASWFPYAAKGQCFNAQVYQTASGEYIRTTFYNLEHA